MAGDGPRTVVPRATGVDYPGPVASGRDLLDWLREPAAQSRRPRRRDPVEQADVRRQECAASPRNVTPLILGRGHFHFNGQSAGSGLSSGKFDIPTALRTIRLTGDDEHRAQWQEFFFSAARFARVLDRWSDGPGPVSTRLLVAIREHIRSGQLPAGARLPSERQVAAALGVARTTVTHAFDTLRTEGLLVSRTGVGTFVSAAGRHVTARGDDRLGSFVHQQGDARIDLRSAALTAIPLVGDVLAGQCAADFSDTLGTHGYVPAGLPILRSAVADYYDKLGLATVPEQVLVTSGAQQALRLVAQAMIEPGDTVLLEEPTYRGAIEVMRSAGARLLGIPSDSHGIDLAALTDVTQRHRPKFILLQSTVHNPTGSVLPEAGRVGVAELAARLGITIVDHLAGMDALIDGAMPRPLAAYGCDVITIGSASKAFWGGLRVGWIRATSDSVGHFTAVKSAEDLGTSIPAQIVTAKLLVPDSRRARVPPPDAWRGPRVHAEPARGTARRLAAAPAGGRRVDVGPAA